MRRRDRLRLEVRAAEIAAAVFTHAGVDWEGAELAGWMSTGDPSRAERSYPKPWRWHAGWLAALIWSGE